MPGSVSNKTIINRTTGNIIVSSFDAGQELSGKTSSFDTYIQVIEGNANLTISERKYKIKTGNGIIIPAHSKHEFIAMEKFKIISTIIKSGYEEFA
jgi:quercetin dioxygenase-like cupin family protein